MGRLRWAVLVWSGQVTLVCLVAVHFDPLGGVVKAFMSISGLQRNEKDKKCVGLSRKSSEVIVHLWENSKDKCKGSQ